MNGGNKLVDVLMGDYRPEVQPGPNYDVQQQLMQKQFPNVDPEQAKAIAQMLEDQGHHEAARALYGNLGSIGLGVGGGLSLAGNPMVGAPLAAAGGVAMGKSMGHDEMYRRKMVEGADANAQAYPGIYGSK